LCKKSIIFDYTSDYCYSKPMREQRALGIEPCVCNTLRFFVGAKPELPSVLLLLFIIGEKPQRITQRMYKSLNPAALGISGRQSELIELAMTYGFKGLDIDLRDLVKRTKRSDFEHAARYLNSAKLGVSGYEVPVDLDSDEEAFQKSIAELAETIETGAKVNALNGNLRLPAGTDRLPYHEYFEVLRKRVSQIGDVMAEQNAKIGLYFSAAKELRADKQFGFVSNTEGFLAFFNSLNHSAVGILVDTWSWTVGGGSVENLQSVAKDKIFSIRLADAATDLTAENASIKSRLMPGEDKLVQNTEIVQYLASIGYKGPVAAAGHQSNLSGMTRDAIVSHAQDCLDKVLSAADVPTETRKPEMFVDLYQPAYANAE
jgi:sugar phosphate isomerase/epimerase